MPFYFLGHHKKKEKGKNRGKKYQEKVQVIIIWNACGHSTLFLPSSIFPQAKGTKWKGERKEWKRARHLFLQDFALKENKKIVGNRIVFFSSLFHDGVIEAHNLYGPNRNHVASQHGNVIITQQQLACEWAKKKRKKEIIFLSLVSSS